MLLQTSMTTRRAFLERSAWGFGSAFLLPSLLQSCTDHIIPDPTKPPTNPPLLGDSSTDWNDDAKICLTTALGMIPEVGEILSGLVDVLWPKGEDVWGEIRNQVQALIGKSISDSFYQTVSDDLAGLKRAMTEDYLPKIKSGALSERLGVFNATKEVFDDALPHFQSSGAAGDFQLLLLPLFGQVVNMYLSLLRDPLLPTLNANNDPILDFSGKPILIGTSWGMNDYDIATTRTALQKCINDYSTYTADTYNAGRGDLAGKIDLNYHLCEPFRTINIYDRQMTLTVLDFMYSWKYYDPTVYLSTPGNPINVEISREIYSDPYGTGDNSGRIGMLPGPTQRPTQLTVWGGDRVQAVQLTYPTGSGPNGVTTTPRMGATGGSNQPPHGGTFTITPDNPIIAGRAHYGDIVNAMQFLYNDGTVPNLLGGGAGLGGNDSGWIGYPYEALSSVRITGVSDYYQSAECVVFGFTYWKSPAAQVEALRKMYVTSPKERSVTDFAQAYPNLAIPAGLITDDLKAARKAYWDSIKAR